MYNKIYHRQANDVASIMNNWSNPVNLQDSMPVNVVTKSTIVYRIKRSFDPQLHYVYSLRQSSYITISSCCSYVSNNTKTSRQTNMCSGAPYTQSCAEMNIAL